LETTVIQLTFEKFADLKSFPNCFDLFFKDLNTVFANKGNWHSLVFKNNNPIVVELGCGKGEYTIGLAEKNPIINFIGLDIKGNRIWTGAKQALDKKLANVAFLRTKVDFTDYCFADNEVSEIWITFPDPQPQKARARQRLTNPIFLNRYKTMLKPGGLVHLKTDSTSMYEYTLEVIKENNHTLLFSTDNLYQNCPADRQELIAIKTHYEKLFTDKGEDIKYCCFQLN
jgi:tRNA (guanine-N7-)-methyltransferase